jgi:hypothetical protein
MDDQESVLNKMGAEFLESNNYLIAWAMKANSLEEKREAIAFFTLAFIRVSGETRLPAELCHINEVMGAVRRMSEDEVDGPIEKLRQQEWRWIFDVSKCPFLAYALVSPNGPQNS